MKGRIATFGLFALLWSFAVVWYFSQQSGSFWGETFFSLPYSFALWFVPLTCTVLSVGSSFTVLKTQVCSKHHFRLGVKVAALSFLGYGVIHATALIFTESASLAFSFFLAFMVFGGLLLFPISVAFGVLAALLGFRLFCANNRLVRTPETARHVS
jgi:hypothetical protein